MNSDEEFLEERLRWLKEAKRISEDESGLHRNPYLGCFEDHYLPDRFQHLVDLDTENLDRHIERLERDIQDAKANGFDID